MAFNPPDFDTGDLTALVGSAELSDRDKRIGQRLLRRLSSPVQVAVCGPDPQMSRAALERLKAGPVAARCPVEFTHDGDMAEADMVLWCTRVFADTEREIWAPLPDSLKDHSFLIACAPPLDQLPRLEDVALDDFVAFHHLGNPDADSDWQAVFCDLCQRIEIGLQAVRDSAQLFVQKHRTKSPIQGALAAATLPDPNGGPVVDKISLFDIALGRFDEHSAAFTDLSTSDADDLGQQVLQLCSQVSEDLVEVFTTGSSDHPDYDDLCHVLYDASDRIVLLSLEDDERAAADAVAILLQIRNDISICQAA